LKIKDGTDLALITSKLAEGYFKVPDFIFNLGLSTYELVVLSNLIRRADCEGISFPGLPRICRDTGIRSENTVRKAIRGLVVKQLVFKIEERLGRVTKMKVSPAIYQSIKIADENYRKKNGKKVKEESNTYSGDEGVTPSFDKPNPLHDMSTKEEKKENPFFFKEESNIGNYKDIKKSAYKSNNQGKNIKYSTRRKYNNDTLRTSNQNGIKDVKQKLANRLIKDFGLSKKLRKNQNKFNEFKKDITNRESAERTLESIRIKNLKDRPKVYDNKLDPFDI